jgi:hypothetical protein
VYEEVVEEVVEEEEDPKQQQQHSWRELLPVAFWKERALLFFYSASLLL